MSDELSDDLQTAIGCAVNQSFWEMVGGDGPSQMELLAGDFQIAYDVLRTPELQAIREALAALLDERCGVGEALDGLPNSVRAWIEQP